MTNPRNDVRVVCGRCHGHQIDPNWFGGAIGYAVSKGMPFPLDIHNACLRCAGSGEASGAFEMARGERERIAREWIEANRNEAMKVAMTGTEVPCGVGAE